VRVLLLSTYELGHQPAGLASIAASLAEEGFATEVADLSLAPLTTGIAEGADAVVFSVPMHTATELALEAARSIRGGRPSIRFAFVGLYAPALSREPLLSSDDLLAAGEVIDAVLRWLRSPPRRVPGRPVTVLDIGPAKGGRAALPARHMLPSISRYARLEWGGRSVPAAAVEASRGCNHGCRHCPVAAIYLRRSRAVEVSAVMADVDQALALGARHISFKDPDFLNRPRHALEVARRLREAHPRLTFDATVKVEHVLRHRGLWPELAGLGLLFVVSAFESTDDEVLRLLEKGHDAAGERDAVATLRRAGIEVRPSWLPFNPWSTIDSVADLLSFSARADLVGSTDAVQYSIRLLLPRGSLLLEQPDPVLSEAVSAVTTPPSATSIGWRHRDGRMDELQAALAAAAEEHAGESPEETFGRIWSIARHAGAPIPPDPPPVESGLASPLPAAERPRLSEAWFCCAEPTSSQLALVKR
jgi:hypothetical protein